MEKVGQEESGKFSCSPQWLQQYTRSLRQQLIDQPAQESWRSHKHNGDSDMETAFQHPRELEESKEWPRF